MESHNNLLNRIFNAFIQRKASKEEQLLFWKWIWRLDASEQKATPTKKERDLLQERIWNNILLGTYPAGLTHKKQTWKRAFIAAAVVTGILLAAGWWLVQYKAARKTVQQFTFSTDGNSLQYFMLPDSTEVTLNIHSSLSYNTTYNDTIRRVILSGEGYFKVHQDNARPFIVQTGALETQALGTAFNIEARENEGQIRVALTEGKVVVALTGGTSKNILIPGQLLRYERLTEKIAIGQFTTQATAWTTGGLVFNGIPLTEALDRLGQHYHIQLQYQEKQLQGKTVTASFDKTSWQNVLANILFPHELEYSVKDSVISIR